jgi:hypothetical protein
MAPTPWPKVFTTVCAALSLVALSASTAAAAIQAGRNVKTSQVSVLDGISATIHVISASPVSGTCLLYDVVAENYAATRQVETGVAYSNNCTLSGCSFSAPIKYVETYDGDYQCYPHGTYAENAVSFRVARSSTTSTTFSPYIGGIKDEPISGIPTDQTVLYLWGERTPNGACGSSEVYAADLKREIYGGGTFTLNGYPYEDPAGQTCFNVTKLADGYFHITS